MSRGGCFRWVTLLPLFAALAWGLLIALIYVFGERDEARPADAIVVLGAAQYNGRPSPVLRARLDHAVQLYERGLAPKMVFTGGVGPGDTVSEAVVGGRYAAARGVPAAAILTERSGMRSIESMRAVAAFMAENDAETAILVSDPFHMLRLRLLALRLGIEARSSPTRTSPISRDRGAELRHVVRESVVIPYTLIFGDS